ncbi:MAG TPA: single-stranded-DNA-specific exonuclease RecJ [Thiolinea sp.]|nr:single-stranded-DNA-specific exonuclease RecJ [Thiolinea sp.]
MNQPVFLTTRVTGMQILTRPRSGNILSDTSPQLSPLARRVLAGRGIDHVDELAFKLHQLHAVQQLGSVNAGASLLAEAVEGERRILVVGDYDADGATATALTLRALQLMGHADVDFLVPDRFKYGYGLTPAIVELAQERSPWLLMTVDNGVSSIEGVAAARALGYRTLITDHHLPGDQLPDCDVMVNPNLHGDGFPSKALAGVGVVFYLMLALKKELGARGYFARRGREEPNLTQLLDLVALGTVADVVPLDGNNRILVEQGLRRMRAGAAQPGITALLQLAGRPLGQVASSDLGFHCGPRLNAAGRLDDMSIGIRCLLTDDEQEARQLAQALDRLNGERKRIEADMKQEAEAIIQAAVFDQPQSELPPIMILHQPDWHEGVIGILAARVRERHYRPVITFASGDGGVVKGSARSVTGLHIRDLLDEVASSCPGLILRFGGHAMAAGLTLKEERLDEFAEVMTAVVARHVRADTFHEVIYTDGELEPTEFCLESADTLRLLAPWGQWFPEPQFMGEFEIVSRRVLKELHLKAELMPVFADGLPVTPVDAIDFFADLERWPGVGERVQLVYQLDVNAFRGQRSLQLKVVWVL